MKTKDQFNKSKIEENKARGTWLNDHTVLEHGFLKKTGALYVMCLLSADMIPQIMALQERVYDRLSGAEKSFIVPKKRAFFEAHLAQGHPIIGVFAGTKLIAQSIIRAPSTQDPETGMVDMPELDGMDVNSVSILQGVLCDPEYRGNNLMDKMVSHWVLWAGRNERPNAIAEIEVRNHHSWSVFLKHGLWLVSIGEDQSDGAKLYNAHQEINKSGKIKYTARGHIGVTFDAAASGASAADGFTSRVACKANDIAAQKALMQMGYACTAWDGKKSMMTLSKLQI
jgi:hypothetical protein